MKFIRNSLFLSALVAIVFFVPVGDRTIAKHLQAIWGAEETQNMVKDIKETSKPMTEKIGKGVKAGWEAATEEEPTPAEPSEQVKEGAPSEQSP